MLCDIWMGQEVVEVVVYVKENDSIFNLYQLWVFFFFFRDEGLNVGTGCSPLPVMGLNDTVI